MSICSQRKSTLILIAFLYLFILLCAKNSVHAWTTPHLLIPNYDNLNARAVTVGDTIYVANTGVGKIFFISSTDDGMTWGNPTQPADTYYYSFGEKPDLALDSSNILHMIWRGKEYPDRNRCQIYHFSSNDGGRNWSLRHRIFYNNYDANYPRITAKGDSLFMICQANFYILFMRSLDGGLTWGDSTVLDSIGDMGYWPSIIYSQGRIHAIWSMGIGTDSTGSIEVYYRSSDDYGLTWSPRIFLSTPERLPQVVDSQLPEAYADANGHIIVTWYDYKYGSHCGIDGDILGRISTDNGTTWLPETRITFTQSCDRSSPLFLDNVFHVVRGDRWPYGCSYPKIEYSTSGDTGQSWSDSGIITGPEMLEEDGPFLFYNIYRNDILFHCLYNNHNTYYIRNKPFTDNIEPVPEPKQDDLQIGAYPNAFNSSTIITFENPKGDNGEIEIFNINGQSIWKRGISGKEGRIIWDATDDKGAKACSGIYFVRVRTSWAEKTVKIVFVK